MSQREEKKPPKASVKYKYAEFGNQLKKLRGKKKKTVFSKMLRVPYNTYLRYEKGTRKPPAGIILLAEILTQWDNKEIFRVSDPRPSYMEDIKGDPFGEAVAALRQIFDSGDKGVIAALQANIVTFSRTVYFGRQITDLKEENIELKKEVSELRDRLATIEKSHFEGLKKKEAM